MEETDAISSHNEHMPPLEIRAELFCESGVEVELFYFGCGSIHACYKCATRLHYFCGMLEQPHK